MIIIVVLIIILLAVLGVGGWLIYEHFIKPDGPSDKPEPSNSSYELVKADISWEEAKEKAEKICELVRREPVESMDGQMIHVTISVGVVVLPMGISLQESEAFIEADKQLYTAKRNGRDQVSMKIEQ